MPTIIALSGSLRRGSYNTMLLHAARDAAPSGASIELESLAAIPLYNGDLEDADGIPAAVAQLKQRIAASDGLLIATPEYNGSIPGVLKNAIDWLSRPSKDLAPVFRGLRVGVIGATPGRGGTRLGQTALLTIWRNLGVRPYFGELLYVDSAHTAFDASGRLVDEPLRTLLSKYLVGFASFVAPDAT